MQLEKKRIQESTEELKAWLKRFTKQAKHKSLDVSANDGYGDSQQICSLKSFS
ncbi:hypothetical protein [cyanobacterium endosymbiont of Epithemia clementina EcSB]|uniref:hypothetical protein n=1 Tax=cyanobacterium endosymbiont of Epithemia clementina EcSB TaxID=3034674 RepID=UPI002480D663|nr:hypothetical protein [cyanobacterium endosymbiont of Epithemia clementina EcSB]WGT66910.1 hypothetical protein P3F56_06585 [cyanobacterium endosymbiont of Epithemia clementina EcSB]